MNSTVNTQKDTEVHTKQQESSADLKNLLLKREIESLKGKLELVIPFREKFLSANKEDYLPLLDLSNRYVWRSLSYTFSDESKELTETLLKHARFFDELEEFIVYWGASMLTTPIFGNEFSLISKAMLFGSSKLIIVQIKGINWKNFQFDAFCKALVFLPSLDALQIEHCDFEEASLYRFADALCSKENILEKLEMTLYDFNVEIKTKFRHFFRALAIIVKERRVRSRFRIFVNNSALDYGLKFMMEAASKGKQLWSGKEEIELKVKFGVALSGYEVSSAYRKSEKSIFLRY